MSIEKHYTKRFDTKRLAPIEVGSIKKEYVTYLEDEPCHLQPLSDSVTSDLEGGFGKDFLMYCDILDIKNTDRIFIDGLEYRITGLETLQFKGNDHLELTVRAFKS